MRVFLAGSAGSAPQDIRDPGAGEPGIGEPGIGELGFQLGGGVSVMNKRIYQRTETNRYHNFEVVFYTED